MQRFVRLALVLAAWIGLTSPAVTQPPASPFADWAAVVVAGDWQGHEGGPSEAFDNARRDVARALKSAGFQPQNLHEFSVRPGRYRPRPGLAQVDRVYDALYDAGARAKGGCLVYFTSHGDPDGVVVGEELLEPSVLAAMLDQACGARPTIVVVSACFSGVFVPEISAPNRMVLTAARADRSSFGCGEADRYPYFDDCFLRAFPAAHDFRQLALAVQACVAQRERETGMSPPSEPQLSIGPRLAPLVPLLPLHAAKVTPTQF